MRKAENVNAPWLGGWVIGAAAGLVAFAVLIVVGDFDFTPAAAIGIVVALLAGLILGIPWGAGDKARFEQASAPAAPVEASRAAEAKPEAMVASFVSAPQAAEPKPAAKPAAAAKPAPKAKAAPKAAAKPKAAAAPKAEAKPKAAKPAKPAGPERLTAPRKGKADDLKEIEGIGPALEKLVNAMGFYHFDQIAKWSEADVALVDAEMKTFKGRITRDKWVSQAKIIVTEGLEAFRERAKTNNY
jgi:predicted flap endonuclease-1-like 5' DNA nuclease